MASRIDDRSSRVVYEYERPRYQSRRDYDDDDEYDVDRAMGSVRRRRYRDDEVEVDTRIRATDTRAYRPPTTTRTTYEVGRGRNSDMVVKRADAVVIERPPTRGRSEYEVVRPERRVDGSYVVDVSDPRAQVYLGRGHVHVRDRERRDDAVVLYGSSRHRDVEILEEDGGYDRRGRDREVYLDSAASSKRLRSSIRGRNDSPPELVARRRAQSVGFLRDQISNHDVSQSRHQRPGAEAHIAGKYLGRRDSDDDSDDDDDYRPARRPHRYEPQRDDWRLHEHEHDEDRRHHTEETLRQYKYEDERRGPYAPQRGHSRRRRRRHDDDRDDDDDARSEYSERRTEVRRVSYR